MLEYLRRTFEREVILGEWLKEAHDSVKTQQYEKKNESKSDGKRSKKERAVYPCNVITADGSFH